MWGSIILVLYLPTRCIPSQTIIFLLIYLALVILVIRVEGGPLMLFSMKINWVDFGSIRLCEQFPLNFTLYIPLLRHISNLSPLYTSYCNVSPIFFSYTPLYVTRAFHRAHWRHGRRPPAQRGGCHYAWWCSGWPSTIGVSWNESVKITRAGLLWSPGASH